MDTHDDPTTTTTTTDYDSGDSEGVDYVYEGQRCVDKKPAAKAKSPRRRKSPRAKPRGPARCVCACGGTAARADDDAESTVFEEDNDTEEDQHHRSRPTKPQPSGPHGGTACVEKGHHKADRKKATEKPHRARSPYIEEYPEGPSRPAILLKEHKIPRRFSASDAKHVREPEDHPPSSGSRGRSPGKPLPPRALRKSSKSSPKHSGHRRRRLDYPQGRGDKVSDHDVEEAASNSEEPATSTPRRLHHDQGPDPTSTIARSSAWHEGHQPQYSSSWPLHTASHMPRKRPPPGRDYDSDEENEEHTFNNDVNFDDEHHRLRQARVPSFREKPRERKHSEPTERGHGHEHQKERERTHHHRVRPRTIVSPPSIETLNQAGRRSVATELCEVWRGRAEDWESPYVSGVDRDSDDDFNSDVDGGDGPDMNIRLLRLEDFPPRTSSPSLLPPLGAERRDFGFQARNRSPPPPPAYGGYMRAHSPPAPCPGGLLYRGQSWAGGNGLLLLEGPPALTLEPTTMEEEEEEDAGEDFLRPPSRVSSRWSRPAGPSGSTRGWTYPGPVTPVLPPPPPRSRGASPVFAARRTREFLSPKPKRPARFDFGAWGCDRASRSSLALGVF